MAWTIERDHLNEQYGDMASRVGFSEEHTRIPVEAVMLGFHSEPLPNEGSEVPFKLFDDDGELYYEGRLHDDDECLNQQAALKWAEADAGCTTIKVLRDGNFVQEIS